MKKRISLILLPVTIVCLLSLYRKREKDQRFCNAKVDSVKSCLPLKYKSDEGPIVALASYPGSGNTWLRHLIQQSTGYLTGSRYKDKVLCQNGFPAEGIRDESVIVVKTHAPVVPPNSQIKETKAIILIRNPFDAFVADFNRLVSKKDHTGHANSTQWERFPIYVRRRRNRWSNFYSQWLEKTQRRLLVKYEELVRDPEKELRRIMAFLKVDVNEAALKCALETRKDGEIFKRHKNQSSLPRSVIQMRPALNKLANATYYRLGLKPLCM